MRLFARHRAEISPRSPSHRLLWASLLLALLLLLTFGAALFFVYQSAQHQKGYGAQP